MDGTLSSALFVIAWLVLLSGLVKLAYVPLAVAFEMTAWSRRRRGNVGLLRDSPLVSVVVPGYNEERVIEACVTSIVANPYPNIEVILVDDGSTDGTAARMQALTDRFGQVQAFSQANGGKGAALNHGFRQSRGDVVMFVDADSVFTDGTIVEALRAFRHDGIGAVCGDDRPANLNRLQTKFLAAISHVGTGLVRRALDLLGCIPVISGNNGAFRRDVLLRLDGGPFRTDTVGEDLELTWRLQRARIGIAFAPRAVVYAESPSTLGGLWKQRVRWARGLLQSLGLHSDMIGSPRFGWFGFFVAYTVISMVIVPVLQLVSLSLLPAWLTLRPPVAEDALPVLMWLGIVLSAVLMVIAAGLDRAWRDLRFAWTIMVWPVYSLLMSCTMLRALVMTLQKVPARWNKLERTGVISVDDASIPPRGIDLSMPHDDSRPADELGPHTVLV